MGQNPYCSIVSAKSWWCHCDVVIDCIVMNIFYKLTLVLSYSIPNLLRSNIILMVRKIGQLLLKGGGGGWQWLLSPQHPPFVQFYVQDGKSDLKSFFMNKWPNDEPAAKNLVRNKSSSHRSSHSRERLEKPVWRGGGGGEGVASTPPWPSEGSIFCHLQKIDRETKI